MTTIDENTEIPVRVIWFGAVAIVSMTAWLVTLSAAISSASASAKLANERMDAYEVIRNERREKNEEFQKTVMSDLAQIKQQLKDLSR